jgi:hypothetical protein
MNMVSGSAVFYCRGEQCLTTSSELSIGLDDIKESILFLHEDFCQQILPMVMNKTSLVMQKYSRA